MKLDGTKRRDVYDKFADDKIGMDEFIETVQRKNTKKTGKNKKMLSQSRLQLASRSILQGDQNEENKAEQIYVPINIADVLADLDKESANLSEEEKEDKSAKRKELNQTTLTFQPKVRRSKSHKRPSQVKISEGYDAMEEAKRIVH